MAVRAVTPRRARAVCVALAGAVWATQAAASSMRCAGGVVGVGDAPGTVLARCGEPDTRAERQRRLRSHDGHRVHVTDVETWSYRRGVGRFVLLLTFEGGLLTRIDRGPRQETR